MICHRALVSGEIDLYAEYTGTALTAILKASVLSDPEEAFKFVAEVYEKRFGLNWLGPFGFNNTYTITVRASDANKRGWERISDLQKDAPRLCAGFTAEFAERPDGYPGIHKIYDLSFGEIRDLDPSLMYKAVSNGEVDVICAFATDGRILSYNLKPLEDDRQFFPPYQAAPVIRKEVLQNHPELEDILYLIEGLLDNVTMQRLNFDVDGKKQRPAEVARTFLRAEGLL
jgi:glycine betaine/choline ABC-type transport system substrate-binding protein